MHKFYLNRFDISQVVYTFNYYFLLMSIGYDNWIYTDF